MKRPVSIDVNAKEVSSVLAKLFAGNDVSYQMEGTHIVLTKAEKNSEKAGAQQQQKKRIDNISGTVLDEAGDPIIGASVYAPSFIEDCEPAVKKLQEEYGFEYTVEFVK